MRTSTESVETEVPRSRHRASAIRGGERGEAALHLELSGWRRRSALVAISAVLLMSTVVWPRVEVAGSVIPFQRLVSYAAFLVTIITLWRSVRHPGRLLGAFMILCAAFLAWTVGDGLIHASAPGFQTLPALMDLSKYGAAFMTAVTVAVGVRSGVVDARHAKRLLIWSAVLFIVVAYVCLFAYWLGFRLVDGFVIKSFGDAWGAWPTDTVIPRLVGLSTEPQQFSVVFVTGLLLMIQERRWTWQLMAALGVVALLLSQSKYSLLSVVVVIVWWFCNIGVTRGFSRRKWALSGLVAIALLGSALALASQLPTFQASLATGLNGGAFTERSGNAGLLVQAFAGAPAAGIGPAQYGVYRAHQLGLPIDNSYYPNNDYLKVAAELGLPGLVLLAGLFAVIVLAIRTGFRGRDRSIVLAAAIGTALIAGNMLIGYELLHVFFWVNAGLLVGIGGVVRPRRELEQS